MIYIGGLMRSGTTLLQELFTDLPNAYIFHEPWFGAGYWQNPHLAMRDFDKHGIDWMTALDRSDNYIDFLKRLPIQNIGVKEIRHSTCGDYFMNFDVKLILIGRNPRDLFISYQKLLDRPNDGIGVEEKTADKLFYDGGIKVDAHRLLSMSGFAEKVHKVRYEDLCNNWDEESQKLEDFIGFINTDNIGKFHKGITRGQYEAKRHHGEVTQKSLGKYDRCEDKDVKEEADKFYDLCEHYNEFWGY